MELWKAVAHYEGRYEVSDQGRVRSLDHVTHDGQRRRGRILRAGISAGYKRVVLASAPAKPVNRLVHRLVLEAFAGPCPEGCEACHENGVNTDCRLGNLRWGTPKSNHADKERHGTSPKGSRNPSAKLDPIKVLDLRARRTAGATYQSLADRFGITRASARFAALGKTWASL